MPEMERSPFRPFAHAQLSLGKGSAALPLSLSVIEPSSASPLSRCAAVFLAAESSLAQRQRVVQLCETARDSLSCVSFFLNCFIAGRRRRACFRRRGLWSAIVKRQVASSHLRRVLHPSRTSRFWSIAFVMWGFRNRRACSTTSYQKITRNPKGNSSLPTVSCRGPAPSILTLTLKGASRAASSPPERTIRRRKDASKSPCRNKTACSLEETVDTTASAGGVLGIRHAC